MNKTKENEMTTPNDMPKQLRLVYDPYIKGYQRMASHQEGTEYVRTDILKNVLENKDRQDKSDAPTEPKHMNRDVHLVVAAIERATRILCEAIRPNEKRQRE